MRLTCQATPWTHSEVVRLSTLWEAGYTAGLIAIHLAPRTRDAVLAKARRLKLSMRGSPIPMEAQ